MYFSFPIALNLEENEPPVVHPILPFAAAAFPFLGLFGLFAIPLMWPLVCRVVPDPPRKDPFVRYLRK